MIGVELAIHDVPDHDDVREAGRHELGERLQLGLGPRLRDIHDPVVGVAGRAALPREVLDRALDPGAVVGPDDRRRLGDHDRRVSGEAPIKGADGRVGRVDVEIHDRGEVQVDARPDQGDRHERRGVGGMAKVVCAPRAASDSVAG